MKICDFAAFLPTCSETCIMPMNSNAFQGSAGAGSANFMIIPPFLVIFMEITKNGVNSKEIGGILTFCSPGGLRNLQNILAFCRVGSRCEEKQQKTTIFMKVNPFSLNLVEFHQNWWIFMRLCGYQVIFTISAPRQTPQSRPPGQSRQSRQPLQSEQSRQSQQCVQPLQSRRCLLYTSPSPRDS